MVVKNWKEKIPNTIDPEKLSGWPKQGNQGQTGSILYCMIWGWLRIELDNIITRRSHNLKLKVFRPLFPHYALQSSAAHFLDLASQTCRNLFNLLKGSLSAQNVQVFFFKLFKMERGWHNWHICSKTNSYRPKNWHKIGMKFTLIGKQRIFEDRIV